MKTEQTIHFDNLLLLVLAVGSLFLTSCSTLQLLRQDVNAMQNDARIVGRVQGADSRSVKILVCKKDGDNGSLSIIDETAPNRLGDFVFVLPADKPYYLAAVGDRKKGHAEKRQAVSFYGDEHMQQVPLARGDNAEALVLKLSQETHRRGPAFHDFKKALAFWNEKETKESGAVSIHCGDIISLDDPLFDSEQGEQGVWAPLTSAKRRGVGLYFLEKYDPQKIPVVFVHGIGGTPRNWKSAIKSLDHRRYQAWVFSYPSGIPIGTAANALAYFSDGLHRQYGFKKLHVVAHSMGGLVACKFVQMTAARSQPDYISSLTTISTPWNGVPSAALGTIGLTAAVPCWFDLRPNSNFIRKILNDPMPVPHLLISTEKSSFRWMLPKQNDGSVSVASQLDQRATTRATATLIVHQDHSEVLEAVETNKALAKFLNTTSKEP